MIALWISCPNKKNAKDIAKFLVKKKLIFFGQIFPVDSFYRWEGKVLPDKQFVLFCETYKSHLPELEKEITRLHQDKVPCWTVFGVDKISQASKRWIEKNY